MKEIAAKQPPPEADATKESLLQEIINRLEAIIDYEEKKLKQNHQSFFEYYDNIKKVLFEVNNLNFQKLIFYCNKQNSLIDHCYRRLVIAGLETDIKDLIWCWLRTKNEKLRKITARSILKILLKKQKNNIGATEIEQIKIIFENTILFKDT